MSILDDWAAMKPPPKSDNTVPHEHTDLYRVLQEKDGKFVAGWMFEYMGYDLNFAWCTNGLYWWGPGIGRGTTAEEAIREAIRKTEEYYK